MKSLRLLCNRTQNMYASWERWKLLIAISALNTVFILKGKPYWAKKASIRRIQMTYFMESDNRIEFSTTKMQKIYSATKNFTTPVLDNSRDYTWAVDTISGNTHVDNRIIARKTFVYIFLCSHVGSPKWIVRDTMVVPSVYWPPASKMTGALSVISIFVSLNVSKCGSDECEPNATVVFSERPWFDLIE